MSERLTKKRSAEKAQEVEASTGSALARGLALLEVLLESHAPLSLTTISERVGLQASTVLRLLKTLEERGHVRRDNSSRYLPSPKAYSPLALMHPLYQLQRELNPAVLSLSEELHETVMLIVFLQREMMVLCMHQFHGSLAPIFRPWLGGAVHATASGYLLLAALDPAERQKLLGPEPYKALTPRSPATAAAIAQVVEETSSRGYAVARDTYRDGMIGIAAPVRFWDGRLVACVLMTAPSNRISEARTKEIAALLVRSANLMILQATAFQSAAQLIGI